METTTTVKKKATWALDTTMLTVNFPNGKTITFDMAQLYPDFAKLSDTMQNTTCYGVKQKLSDAIARPASEKLTIDESATIMVATFANIVDGSAWTRKAGGGQVSFKTKLTTNMDLLSEEDKATMLAIMAKMNCSL